MKINRYGAVILTQTAIRIEGWRVEREETDPSDATNDQLMLGTVTDWALTQLKMELAKLQFAAFQQKAAEIKDEIRRKAESESPQPADGKN